MATTYEQVRDAAYGKSSKNQLGVLTTEPEDLAQIHRIVQGAFAFSAVLNPNRLSTSLAVVGGAGGAPSGSWVRPEDAEAIVAIRHTTLGDIAVVPFDDPLADDPKPSIYEFGGLFTLSPNQANPPGPTDTFTFFYAKRPDTPTVIGDDIDPLYPDAYVDLLAAEYAIYLSRKDGRMEEVAAMSQDRDMWAQRFGSWLQRGTPIERRRFAQRNVHTVDSLIPMIGGG